MLLLSKQDIQTAFSMNEAIDAAKEACRILSLGTADTPLRMNLAIEDRGQTLFMPGHISDLGCAGLKVVSVFPGNAKLGKPTTPATMLLIDVKTGEVVSILDGTYLTQLRTGAVAGAATDLMANKDATVGALIGTGGQAATQLEAMLAVRKLSTVKVFSPTAAKAAAFVSAMRNQLGHYGADIVQASASAEAVTDADIITVVTTAKSPVFDGKLVKPGAHINAVGSFTPEMQELDEHIVIKAVKFIADSREAVLAEAGDILKPMAKGLVDENRIDGELGEVVMGRVRGRTSTTDITIFKTVGTAVFDIVTADRVYKKASAAKTGQTFNL